MKKQSTNGYWVMVFAMAIFLASLCGITADSFAACGELRSGCLYQNGSVDSCNGKTRLVHQTDGNVVLYEIGGSALWPTKTAGKATSGFCMQPDGNLVLYDNQGKPIWNSGTAGHPGAWLAIQNDCNLVIYDSVGKAIWWTGTKCSNNSGLPDVFIKSLSTIPANPKVGDRVKFNVVVRNGGNAGTGKDVGVGYFVNGTYVGYGIRPAMAAGTEASNFQMVQEWVPNSAGNYTISALVDDVNRFVESNENNNSYSIVLPVSGSGLPDVFIERLWTIPANPKVGDRVKINVQVRNGGNAGTGAVVGVGYFVNGNYVGWGSRSAMAAGEVSSNFQMIQDWIPSSAGNYTICAVVDDVNRFAESDENNNRFCITLTITGNDTIDPLNYMKNSTGKTLKCSNCPGYTPYVSYYEISAKKIFFYVKGDYNNLSGALFEQYAWDDNFIWLKRDTSWPLNDSDPENADGHPCWWYNGKRYYVNCDGAIVEDASPYPICTAAKPNDTYEANGSEALKWASRVWKVGEEVTFNTTIQGLNHHHTQYGTTCAIDWQCKTLNIKKEVGFSGKKIFKYHEEKDWGGDIRKADSIGVQYNIGGNAYEIHWYALNWGWVSWEYWKDGTLNQSCIWNIAVNDPKTPYDPCGWYNP